jgi:hypothetical protein
MKVMCENLDAVKSGEGHFRCFETSRVEAWGYAVTDALFALRFGSECASPNQVQGQLSIQVRLRWKGTLTGGMAGWRAKHCPN